MTASHSPFSPTSGPAAFLTGYTAVATARSLARLTTATTEAWTRVAVETGPVQASRDGLRWWGHVTGRRRPRWTSEHEIVFGTPIARLRDFTAGASDDVVPTLVLPPQAGHDSCIVDYNAKQSQLETIRAAGLTRAFSLDWIGATRETRHTTIDDYLAVIDRAIDTIGGPVNLIGDCQGGWLAAIYAALHPRRIHTLTLAGASIDFHAGDSVIAAATRLITGAWGMAPYRALVAAGGGNMPGRHVLGGFVGIRPEAEIGKQLQLLGHLDDLEHLERYHVFEDWFQHPQDVPGAFYLWLVEHLFRRNELIRGELRIGDRRVDLREITCPLFLLAGADDHITPPPQLFAAAGAVGTAPEQVTRRTSSGGHLGLFMGREALREHWPPLLAAVHASSGPDTRADDDQRRSRAVTVEAAAQPPVPAP